MELTIFIGKHDMEQKLFRVLWLNFGGDNTKLVFHTPNVGLVYGLALLNLGK